MIFGILGEGAGGRNHPLVIPAKAGIQIPRHGLWIPAFAEMTRLVSALRTGVSRLRSKRTA